LQQVREPASQKEEKKKGTGGGTSTGHPASIPGNRSYQYQSVSHLAGVFIFFLKQGAICTGVRVSSPHVTASKEELDLTTQWAKVMEAIKPRRGDLA